MAEDTREGKTTVQHPIAPSSSGTDSPKQVPYQGKVYEVFNAPPTPPESANVLPGGSANTAGGRPKEAGVVDALKSIKPEDFFEVHKKPCVRESLLTGIGSAFAVGSVRAVLGGTMLMLASTTMDRLLIRGLDSIHTQSMQLGRGDVLSRVVCHARVLPAPTVAGAADHEKSG